MGRVIDWEMLVNSGKDFFRVQKKKKKKKKKKEILFYLRVGFSPSKKSCFICFSEGPLKTMKNTLYLILKLLLVLRPLFFCPDFFGHIENDWTRKLKLISKFMMS